MIRLASSPDGIRQPVPRRPADDHGDNNLESWRQDLARLDLPNDAVSLTDVGSTEDPISLGITLQPDVVGQFEALCQESNATLEMGLIVLVAALLRRYCQQDSFAIGAVIAVSQPTDQPPSSSVGCAAVHTLAIPIRWSDGLSFWDLLQEVRLKRLEAAVHTCNPANSHPENNAHQREATPIHLLQVLLGLDVNLGLLSRPEGGEKPELMFGFERLNTGLQVSINYNLRRFLPARIDRAANHLKVLLDGILADSGTPISQLPLLTAAENRQLASWSQGPELALPLRCLHQLFERQVASSPNTIALVFEEKSLTYTELNTRANRLAHYLIGLGIRPDDRVAIAVERSLEMMVGLLAILKAGGAYVPLDPTYPQQRLAFMLEDSAPVTLLVHGATQDRMASLAGTVPMIDLDADATAWVELSDANPETASLGLRCNHLAYVIYTSGSTGKPKGVMVEHRGVCNLVSAQIREFLLGSGSSVLQFASFSFDAFVMEAFNALCSGAVLHLPVPETKLAGEALVRMITDHGITHALLSPSVLATLPEDCRCKRSGAISGHQQLSTAGPPRIHDRRGCLLAPDGLQL